LTGTALTANGSSVPALHVSGGSSNSSSDAVIFEYRLHGATDWNAGGIEPPATKDKVITSVTPGTAYDVAVSYRVRGNVGARLILGPVTAGSLSVPGAESGLILNSYTTGLAANIASTDAGSSATITIPAHMRVYGDRTVSINAGSLPGLSYATTYLLFYDDAARAGGAVTFQSTTVAADAYSSAAHPARHFLAYVQTVAAGGTGGSAGGSGPPGSGGWNGHPGTQIP
jgi:hypothetical protein